MSDNRTTELLPCPFCGGEAELKRYQSGDWQVICYHADGCIMLESDLDNCYWENVQTLARQWNARAERTCRNTHENRWFKCSACGYGFTDLYAEDESDIDEQPRYCPNCGCKAVDA